MTAKITYGTGTYGHPVQQDINHLQRHVLITGTTQTGKTRLANSLARQQSAELGAGQVIINFKPDDSFRAEKARDAERLGRSFLHFSLAPKGNALYRQVHPYEPPLPCFYDPLARGSGAVRARMLIDSVVHNDTSDVYRRNAIEVSSLCWDIARLTGNDYEIGPDGRRRQKRALHVLLDMLNLDHVEHAADQLTPALVQRHHPHLHADDADMMVRQLQSRATSIKNDANLKSSTMGSAIADTRSIVSQFLNSSAFISQSLSIGANPSYQIDLLRAIVRGEHILFSLSAADYQQEATMLGSMILLDLQNTVSTLRDFKTYIDTTAGSGPTPWAPLILQIEELGTAAGPASAGALIGLINKSADVGIRPLSSTQSLADLRGIDANGVYLQRILALTSDLISLQIGGDVDDKDFCEFSGNVNKKIPTSDTDVSNNRLNIFTGAKRSKSIRAADTTTTRVPDGSAQQLVSDAATDTREMLWITKTPKVSAVHTTGPEGPNNWHEVIKLVPVGEAPRDYRPFEDQLGAERSALAAKLEARRRVLYENEADSMLQRLRELNDRRLEFTDATTADEEHSASPEEEAATGAEMNVEATSATDLSHAAAAADPNPFRTDFEPDNEELPDFGDPFAMGIDD